PLSPTTVHPFVSFNSSPPHRALHSFPTRRSSDLDARSRDPGPQPDGEGQRDRPGRHQADQPGRERTVVGAAAPHGGGAIPSAQGDRKSTRLNSSHVSISYAVFCLKKKTKNRKHST